MDWKIQKGNIRPFLPSKFPFIPERTVSDVAAEVVEVDSAVKNFNVGDKVVAYLIMKAVRYTSYGGGAAALKHVEVPIPTPKKDEVLLKVEAASLNPMDWKVQKGFVRPFLPAKFPFIPVSDVSAEVVEVGSAIKNFKVGDKVVAYLSGGGLAEYVATKPNVTVQRPAEVSAAEAAGLPIAACTAMQMLQAAGIKLDRSGPLSNILVTAASGGVGHYAVQLAKLGNTHVTATCGARNMELVKSLGADEVLDYKTPEGAALKCPSGAKYDVVLHCTGAGLPWSIFEPVLSDKGKVIDIAPGPKAFLTSAIKKITCAKKKFILLLANPKAENLEELVNLMKEGKIKTVIDSKHPLSKAEDGWGRCLDGHATGKIIVEP